MDSGQYKIVELEHSCQATVIPGGQPMLLQAGEQVVITQTLGASVTVQTSMGYLVRISAEDSAALGLSRLVAETVTMNDGPFDLDQVLDALKNVFDPEIPINVVDLGLIYLCEAEPLPDGTHRVEVNMSMTAPGCGMGDVLKEDARTAIQAVPGVGEIDIELVWDPPWGQDRMSEAARLQLGMY
ncbi:putative Fe-S cluster assembly protein SufT [Cryobacterium levicorallinum]|uniref:Probable FeS assembly SUF system protein SufT n=1 Tax=Cryobacterium levicorallinum TaxID=995038 RepID=A0A1I3AIF6_9MICO|nr:MULTISPECIES: putative Fe-S cluster assembly protein SufT [Cryobacterium]TFB86615.1 putative Fe-S cluster assembly protein SufT [Cryobacterium levicorallinum]GEP26525.1 putative Fe-S cluster assembly protein SufT [Cryobacterium levicorallinum]SFH49838.1 probable FeS assembly SUF system protein SufT [Cryobacterium levicorallinum]